MTKPDNSDADDAADRDTAAEPAKKPAARSAQQPAKPPVRNKPRPVMPTAREAAAAAGDKPPPAVVNWGFYVIALAVVVGVVGAIYLMLNKDTLVNNQLTLEGAEKITREEAERVVSNALWTLIVINVVFGAFQGLFAYKAREGQRKARMLVTIATVIVVVFHYLAVPTLFGQLAGLLAAIGCALLYLPGARDFYPPRQPVK